MLTTLTAGGALWRSRAVQGATARHVAAISTFQQPRRSTVRAGVAPVWITGKREISSTTPLLYARSNRALELKYVDGTCMLAVPLPLSGFDEERVFSIPPEATVGDMIAQISAEDKSVQTVDVRTKRGKSFKHDETLTNVFTDDFELLINENVMPVTAPVFTGNAYASLQDDGDLDVRSVAQKSAVISVRHALETSKNWKMSLGEYIQLCQERGIPKKQAVEVLKSFHQAGIVFYFGKANDEDLQHSIFLQPRTILDSYLESLGLSPVSKQLFLQKREELLKRIQALEPEHVALRNLQKELERAATRHANGVAYLLSTSLVGGFGLYFWLSFIHFSWDIMEPVTYFTGFGMSIVGYTWWSFTNQEYEYENIYDYFYRKKLLKLTARAKFDGKRFARVTENLELSRQQLNEIEVVLKKPTHLQASYLHLLQSHAHDDELLRSDHHSQVLTEAAPGEKGPSRHEQCLHTEKDKAVKK
ncbi:TPA: hypothetical protein N0F65_011279 [Lagenidium giganteum]|uniref:Calcium uniporter protein C-terminal domain-containing protein n=1 Tax=Lagenidium giganteum TaxID=4803 RepID=A0AAV2YTI5_9STRA|nr:TPA: hypothetical protein N0F65_011279 [Lagenidium giganteum]